MSVRYRTCRQQKIWFLHNDRILWLSSTTELHSSKQKIYHRDVGERKKKLYALHVVGSYIIIIFHVLQCVHRTHIIIIILSMAIIYCVLDILNYMPSGDENVSTHLDHILLRISPLILIRSNEKKTGTQCVLQLITVRQCIT